jgi:hypothetical protein
MNANDEFEHDPRFTVAEASEIGWPPGEWPETLELNGRLYVRERFERERHELVAGVYGAPGGYVVHVLND